MFKHPFIKELKNKIVELKDYNNILFIDNQLYNGILYYTDRIGFLSTYLEVNGDLYDYIKKILNSNDFLTAHYHDNSIDFNKSSIGSHRWLSKNCEKTLIDMNNSVHGAFIKFKNEEQLLAIRALLNDIPIEAIVKIEELHAKYYK